MPLKINVRSIREQKGGSVAGQLIILPRELGLPSPEEMWRPFTFTYTFTNAGDVYVLKGRLASSTLHQCSRCLAPVETPLVADVLEQFNRCFQRAGCPFIHGDEIDITEILRENAVLNLPAKPLCSPDCRGLCPSCGADLNRTCCGCGPQPFDGRLAVLENLISKRSGGVNPSGGTKTQNLKGPAG